jgi:hypothetical protein
LQRSQHPKKLAFAKHATSGAYAVHAAVEKGMDGLALALADPGRYPGVLQQQDANGCVPLAWS